jgi:UDP-N-acetylmuramoyl-tripeptide--D-alanyl-D-alanine ligase
MQLTAAARALEQPLLGPDREFAGVSTDTRTLRRGELFVALKGPRFDAHDLLARAAGGGASGAVLERRLATELPSIVVADTRRALGQLAKLWRERFTLPVIAVTGSSGKTTVKEMCAAILREDRAVLATRGSLNNDIGVPQTLFQLDAAHQAAVLELGANHPGEIAWLTCIARPQVAIVTLCAPAHLEGFASIKGVAQAKAEIFDGLSGDGTAVINAEDPFASLWRERAAGKRIVTFGWSPRHDFHALEVDLESRPWGSHFRMHTPNGAFEVTLSAPGRHNVMNALAAAAGAWAIGANAQNIMRGLSRMVLIKGRMQIKIGLGGATIIDDTYNANPASARAAIDVLAGRRGERWLVLGDMGELGDTAPDLHRQVGEYARAKGIEHLVTLGGLAREAGRGFGAGAVHCDSVAQACALVRASLHGDATVLVKASRAMQLERVVVGLDAGGAPSCSCG